MKSAAFSAAPYSGVLFARSDASNLQFQTSGGAGGYYCHQSLLGWGQALDIQTAHQRIWEAQARGNLRSNHTIRSYVLGYLVPPGELRLVVGSAGRGSRIKSPSRSK